MGLKTRNVLSVFLASPGDLKDERSAINEIVESLNKIVRNLNWHIDLLAWEETLACCYSVTRWRNTSFSRRIKHYNHGPFAFRFNFDCQRPFACFNQR